MSSHVRLALRNMLGTMERGAASCCLFAFRQFVFLVPLQGQMAAVGGIADVKIPLPSAQLCVCEPQLACVLAYNACSKALIWQQGELDDQPPNVSALSLPS